MKKILIAFVAAAGLLCSCDKDDTTVADREFVNLSAVELSTEPDGSQALASGPDGGQYKITVSSSGDWRVAGDCDWARLSATSGHDGDVVTLTVDPNETQVSCETTYKFFTGATVVSLKVSSSPVYALELVSDSEMTFEADQTLFGVELQTNIPSLTCTFDNDGDSWITYDTRSDGFGKTVLKFSVEPNPGYDDRSTVLTVSGHDKTCRIKITQRQIDDIQIEETSMTFDLSERTIPVEVKANVAYEVSIEGDWITQVMTRGLVTERLQFHLAAAAASRAGKITIRGAGVTREITVIQKDPDAELITIGDAALRSALVEKGWVLKLSKEAYILTEDGMNATEFVYNPSWPSPYLESLDGIEHFPELTKIDVSHNNLSKLDISSLTKVTSLIVDENSSLEYINLGTNPVTSMKMFTDFYVYAENVVVIGEKLTSLDMSLSGWVSWYDKVVSLDVSECPSLETLNCDRESETFKTLYLKQGQTIPNLTKGESTAIVYK